MRVEFHTDVADPVTFSCRLLRKAYRTGARVAVFGPQPTLARLDQALWTFEPHEFVPHAKWSDQVRGSERTPIWLVGAGTAALPECAVAVNLGHDDAERFASFDRLIEIVSAGADEVRAARARWRRYREIGAMVEHQGAGPATGS